MSWSEIRGWAVDLLAGGLAGLAVAWIVAVNIVIFSGVDRGYQSSVDEVFRHSTLLGVTVVGLIVLGPVCGVSLLRRRRRRRDRPDAGVGRTGVSGSR